MPFSEVIGQKPALKALQRSLKERRLAHAYLFVGPEGVGKKLVARLLAQAINCDLSALPAQAGAQAGRNDGDACGRCSSCQRIEGFSHPDVTWVKPGGLSRRIGIDDIRDLRHQISLKAYHAGRKKIFVFTEADRLTAEASNALLKTLEEPPADSLLILLTSHSFSLFPTIISRCQLIRFSPLPLKEIKDYLRAKLKLTSAQAQLLSRLSEGRLGKALSLREKVAREERKKVLDLVSQTSPNDDLEELLRRAAELGKILSNFKRRLEEKLKKEVPGKREEMFTRAELRELKEERLAFLGGESRKKIKEVLDTITGWYRDLLILREGGEEAWLINSDRKEELRAKAKTISPLHIRKSIDLIERTKQSLDHYVNLRLSLEAMFMKMQEELRDA